MSRDGKIIAGGIYSVKSMGENENVKQNLKIRLQPGYYDKYTKKEVIAAFY